MQSIETKSSWIVATVVLVILAVSFGAPWITVVALKPIAAETGGLRSVPALASALAWLGFGTGGIVDGADRRAGRRALDGDVRRRDDLRGACALDLR